MPATAGRVRMPANNRVHSSAALQTHGIWQSAIGYDPYAPTADKDSSKSAAASKSAPAVGPSDEAGGENAYASFQGLLALARVTRSDADDTRGACKRCGRVGHLTFQCRNFLSVKDDKDKDDLASIQTANAVFDKIKKGNGKGEEESEISEEESESEDSDADSEMDRIIAERFGKKRSGKEKEKESRRGRSKKRSSRRARTSSDESEEVDRKERKRRRRGDEDRKSRREKRRRRSHREEDDSSEEDRRRRRRRHRRSGGRKESSGSESESSESDYRRKRRSHKRRKDHNESDVIDRDVARNTKRSE